MFNHHVFYVRQNLDEENIKIVLGTTSFFQNKMALMEFLIDSLNLSDYDKYYKLMPNGLYDEYTYTFAKGEFESRVKLGKSESSVKELNELADTFNNMAFELEKF